MPDAGIPRVVWIYPIENILFPIRLDKKFPKMKEIYIYMKQYGNQYVINR